MPEIHENQNGYAEVTGALTKRRDLGAFSLSADDGGSLELMTSGDVATDVAYYDQPELQAAGQPTHMGGPRKGAPTVLDGLSISWDKPSNYLVVRAHSPAGTGTYKLEVLAPPANFAANVKLTAADPSNSVYHGISGTNDCDFYRIKVPLAGDWEIKAAANAGFDPTMNIYDAKGNPVGGTYTNAIDNTGIGGTESWTGTNVAANTVYYVRVDGAGDSIGNYHLFVQLVLPTVRITTNVSSSRAAVKHGGFTLSRAGDLRLPLIVHYHVTGSAVPGRDYAVLSGLATIPAGQSSATISIDSRSDPKANADKTVVLSLSPSKSYTLNQASSAILTLNSRMRT